ncbi:hypothetical protein HID58_086518, partial [Brassica napus]
PSCPSLLDFIISPNQSVTLDLTKSIEKIDRINCSCGVFYSPAPSVGDAIDGTLDFISHLLFSFSSLPCKRYIMAGRGRGRKKSQQKKSTKRNSAPVEEQHVEELSTENDSDDLSAHGIESDNQGTDNQSASSQVIESVLVPTVDEELIRFGPIEDKMI